MKPGDTTLLIYILLSREEKSPELEGPGNDAYLWLSVTKQGFGPQSRLFTDNMKDRPIKTSEWRFFEITGEVSDEAQWIYFGIALTGEGSAWFDSFSLQIVEP